MNSYVIPPPVIYPPRVRDLERRRRAWRVFGPLLIGAATFPFFWIPTLSVPPDPTHPIDNLHEIGAALSGETGWIRSLKVGSDINRIPERYAQVVVAGAKADPKGEDVLSFLESDGGIPGELVRVLQTKQEDADWRVRRMAARAMRLHGNLGWEYTPDDDASVLAVRWLSDPSPEVREEGVQLVGSHASYPPDGVRELALSKDPEIKVAAIRAMARSGTQLPQDLALFKRVTKNPDPRIRTAAWYALRNAAGG